VGIVGRVSFRCALYAHSSKWYQGRRLENLEYLRDHIVTGEPVNISGRSHGLCVAGELDSGSGECLPEDHMGCM